MLGGPEGVVIGAVSRVTMVKIAIRVLVSLLMTSPGPPSSVLGCNPEVRRTPYLKKMGSLTKVLGTPSYGHWWVASWASRKMQPIVGLHGYLGLGALECQVRQSVDPQRAPGSLT